MLIKLTSVSVLREREGHDWVIGTSRGGGGGVIYQIMDQRNIYRVHMKICMG